VSAALLSKRGFDVVGVFFRFFDPPKAGKTDGSLGKAKLIAEKLSIPLKTVDARGEFKKKIIDYFVSSYKKGITPNPCVVCNREMKFDLLFKLLKKYKADCIATGHYARIKHVIARSETTKQSRAIAENTRLLRFARNDSYMLLEAIDKTKDQSYFLYRLARKELAKIIFPLGGYKKTETKKMAKKFGLPVLGNEESQDICFLLDKDINQFLRKNIKPMPGNIVDEKGNLLGGHKGLPFYTFGQRKGIEIGGTGPYFVVGKNSRKNVLIVSNDPKKLLAKKFEVNQANWIGKGIKLPLRAEVQVRYHSEKFLAIIKSGLEADASRRYGVNKSEVLTVEAKKNLRAVAPGQSAVFYRNGEVLGGGIIL